MSDKISLPTPEINSYTNSGHPAVVAHYKNGELLSTNCVNRNKIDWDGLKHSISYFESEIDTTIFSLIQ